MHPRQTQTWNSIPFMTLFKVVARMTSNGADTFFEKKTFFLEMISKDKCFFFIFFVDL